VRDLPSPSPGGLRGVSEDGRVVLTYRSGIGRRRSGVGGAAEDDTDFRIGGAHINDAHSVGLRDGALHIDNDGACGQFTRYFLRPPDSPRARLT